jgi:hypothetical protein
LAFSETSSQLTPQRRVRCEPRSNRSRNITAIIVGTAPGSLAGNSIGVSGVSSILAEATSR